MFKILLLLFLAMTPVASYTQDSIPNDKIQHMMDLMGANKQFMAVLDQMAAQYMEGETDPSQIEFWEAFLEECRTTGIQEIMSELIPVYRKHLTENEVDALIAFYGSPAGQTLRDKLPLITVEASKVGEEWGMNTALRILNQLEEQNEHLFEVELEGCEKFREGQFIETMESGSVIYIDRKGHLQTETHEDGKQTLRIEWVGPCRYILYPVKPKSRELKQPLRVNIYEVGPDSYKYITRIEGEDLILKGEIRIEK